MSEAALLTSLSRSQIYRLELADKFPRKVQIGNGRVGYLLQEVEADIDSLPRVPSRPTKSSKGRINSIDRSPVNGGRS
ncbi:AlpA family phage regulatory protein [Hyphomicrobium sp.]|uniref:helix-turn-helix transcriptional regulator n=1 Tax=Hyphomicrobium sp. TaxID=82 RepID=UPI003458CB45